jgi:Domain of unknown function (DUF5655)
VLARSGGRRPTDGPGADGDPADALYAGAKAGLRPIHDAVLGAVLAFGDDIETVPKKGYLSLRRRKQFAMIQPGTSRRVDLGLILGDVPPNGRLEPAARFNAMFTHRVRLADRSSAGSGTPTTTPDEQA